MERSPRSNKLRVFFALVPDAATQRSLGVIARDVAAHGGGRAIVDANLHMTLAFVGDTSTERVDMLRAIVPTLPRRRFALILDRIGTFNHSELAWIAPTDAPVALAALQSALATALESDGFTLETRPFHPHITLARRCTRTIATARFEKIAWNVERFALLASIASDGGVRYRELRGVTLD